jgi:putative transcriptional regulator
MSKPTNVTNRIADLRAERAMTQGELADLIGVTRQTVNAMELAKYSPSLETAFRIANVFGVELTNVFGYSPTHS